MSYTVKIYWKNCPKWDSDNVPFMDHLLYNVSLDVGVTLDHISQLSQIPVSSLTQTPSPDLDTGWITTVECSDLLTLELINNFYTNTIIPTLIENRQLIIEVIDNGN